jgi:hypothetical protein
MPIFFRPCIAKSPFAESYFILCRHWLVERPDKVTAKGKGLMQTYWCEPLAKDGKSTVGSEA